MTKMLHIIPECYVDTNLIEFLLGAAVNHQHCCSKVVGTMNDKFGNQFAIGIIDKDKVEMGYLRECDTIAQYGHLTLYKHKIRHHYLFTIAPAIDKFVLDCSQECGIVLGNYDLPSDLPSFTKVTKQITSNKDRRFKKLFSAIQHHDEIIALRETLTYINENKYYVDISQLKKRFTTSRL